MVKGKTVKLRMFSNKELKEIFERAWNKLVDFYKKGHRFWHENDMRCLLYHFCAQQIGDENLRILHSEYKAPSGRRFDLILSEGETGGIAIELKCGTLESSGIHQKEIETDTEKLRYAIREDNFASAYFCVLDEFGKVSIPNQLEEQNIIIKKFSSRPMV